MHPRGSGGVEAGQTSTLASYLPLPIIPTTSTICVCRSRPSSRERRWKTRVTAARGNCARVPGMLLDMRSP
jgi:hypothetical protein